MKGHPDVVNCLCELLKGELAARDQYFLHSRQYQDEGYPKLYERLDHEMQEETDHADAILKRILLLEGEPEMTPHGISPGGTLIERLEADLRLEYKVRQDLADAIALCESAQDYQTRDMLRLQLQDTEEDHTYWLEKQLRLIKLMGEANYRQLQAEG